MQRLIWYVPSNRKLPISMRPVRKSSWSDMCLYTRTVPDIPLILDAKRGDIGATAQQYAREAFER